MTLKEHIVDISNQLKQGAFANERERAVSQRIVNRLLQALEWPIFTPQIVIDEYGVEGRRVDFALCHPESIPRAFIEAKRLGNIDKGIKQLFEYAFHRGIPIVVLTDGQKWRFYHPAGEGSYEDRMVVELDLIADDSEDCSNYFGRYLSYESVRTGKAAKIITADYQRIVSQRKVEERLPEIWSELLQEKNEYLFIAMVDKAKEKVGHEPTEEQVLTFLKSLSTPSTKPRPKPEVVPDDRPKPSITRIRVIMSDGRIIEQHHAKDTFVEVIVELGLEEVMRFNPTIVSKEPFYSHRDNWKNLNAQQGEYYVNINNDSNNKKRLLESIAKQFSIQLKVELTEK